MCDTYNWQKRSIFIWDNPILFSDKLLRKNYDRKGSVAEEKIYGRGLKGLGAKTNWLGINRQS
jgi:hypothetical protein